MALVLKYFDIIGLCNFKQTVVVQGAQIYKIEMTERDERLSPVLIGRVKAMILVDTFGITRMGQGLVSLESG